MHRQLTGAFSEKHFVKQENRRKKHASIKHVLMCGHMRTGIEVYGCIHLHYVRDIRKSVLVIHINTLNAHQCRQKRAAGKQKGHGDILCFYLCEHTFHLIFTRAG